MNLQKLAVELEEEEGRVHHAYQDHLGYWTIGIGFLIDKRKGGGLRDVEIDFILQNRVREVSEELDRAIPWWRKLSEERQHVVFQMGYQMGVPTLMTFKNTLGAMKDGRYADAEAGMLASKWARQTPNRAKKLAKIMKGDA